MSNPQWDPQHGDAVDPRALAVCPYRIDKATMVQGWRTLTFLHWRYPAEQVQRLVPPGLTIEEADGSAWVSLIPFRMEVGLPRARSMPWAGRFCETNVRTYVTDKAGRSGIWFFSLDAARLGAVTLARSAYRLPYFWSEMSLRQAGNRVEYRCRRRWPGPRGATSHAVIEVGAPYQDDETTPLENFLTARWALFSVSGDRQRFALARHDPWPLRRARLVSLDDDLVAAAGLPAPTGEPLVEFSEGVAVRIGHIQR